VNVIRFSHAHRVVLCAIVLVAARPGSASAQTEKSGEVSIENTSGETIRIGCEYYIDSLGLKVALKAHWDISSGKNTKLLTADLKNIVARKFVMYLITPEGESQGWTLDKFNAQGNLAAAVSADTLKKHKELAGNNLLATSGYPALTKEDAAKLNKEAAAANRNVEIARLEADVKDADERLTKLKVGEAVARATHAAVIAECNKVINDPNSTFGQVLAAGLGKEVADGVLDKVIQERKSAATALDAFRDRLAKLKASP